MKARPKRTGAWRPTNWGTTGVLLAVIGLAAPSVAWGAAQATPPPPSASNKVKVHPAKPPVSPPELNESADVEGGPRALFADHTKDFGEFWAGADLNHRFIIKNVGADVLQILRVKPSCGCTSTGYDKQIAPGKEGKIDVKVRTKNFNGKFTKTVTVTTNDPANPNVRLRLVGVAKQHISVQPRTAAFTKVQPDQTLQKTLKISNNSDEPMKLTPEKQKIGPFTARLREVEPGKTYELEITGAPPYESKLNRATFQLTTNVAAKPRIDVPCSAYVPPRLEIRPAAIQLRATSNKETRRTVRFLNNGKQNVKVLGVEVKDPKVRASVREQNAGKDYAIEVKFPAGYEPGPKGTKLIVTTNDPEKPILEVPITKMQPRKPRPKPGEKLVGHPAPKVEFKTVAGKAVGLGEAGEVRVITFYVSWCGFCKRALPEVEKLYQEYKDKGVRFVAVSEDTRQGKRGRTEEQIAEHFKTLHLTMERALDPDHHVGRPYFAQSYPTMYILGKDGRVEAAHFGAKRDLFAQVSHDLNLLLAGKSPSEAKAAGAAAAAKSATPKPAPGIKAEVVRNIHPDSLCRSGC